MEENNGGFAFGAPRQPKDSDGKRVIRPVDPDEPDELDAVEVDSEPVSRNEAKNLGLVRPEPVREERAGDKMRLDRLPPDVGDELTDKLKKAWNHLKRNEIEEALTLAQEVVFEYPSLVAAKLIIARCFINRKEYDKGLAILQAIPEQDKTDETLYYVGLCLSRLGKIKEAIEALKQSRAASTDALIRKRANDLLLHLQGEQAVCPICGRKTLYDNMVEVGNRTICSNCAKKEAIAGDDDEDEYDDDDGDEDDEDYIRDRKRRKKRLRPPLTKADLAIRLLFVVFVFILLALGIYLMYLLAPSYYSEFRAYLPASWHFLPQATRRNMQSNPSAQAEQNRPLLPNVVFSSPGVHRAIAGMETRHQIRIEGADTQGITFGVSVDPAPQGFYHVNPQTGLFVWTPGREDGGKDFTVNFAVNFNNQRIREQVNTVQVSSGPDFRLIGKWPEVDESSIVHLLADDLDGDGRTELIFSAGEYWRGGVSVLNAGEDGEYTLKSKADLAGRPVGLGVVMAGPERWLGVADYWNSRLRYFALRDGTLSEMAMGIDLPGRPVLAGFDEASSVVAVLCRVADSMRVVAYKQENQLTFRTLGEWRVPDEFVWRRLLVLPGTDEVPPLPVLLGGDFANSFMILEPEKNLPRIGKNPNQGILIDAAKAKEGQSVHCLAEVSGNLEFSTLGVVEHSIAKATAPVFAGPSPALAGFVTTDLSGNNREDIVILGSTRVGISFGGAESTFTEANYWPLPAPARLFSQITAIPLSAGGGNEVVYLSENGELWAMRVQD